MKQGFRQFPMVLYVQFGKGSSLHSKLCPPIRARNLQAAVSPEVSGRPRLLWHKPLPCILPILWSTLEVAPPEESVQYEYACSQCRNSLLTWHAWNGGVHLGNWIRNSLPYCKIGSCVRIFLHILAYANKTGIGIEKALLKNGTRRYKPGQVWIYRIGRLDGCCVIRKLGLF